MNRIGEQSFAPPRSARRRRVAINLIRSGALAAAPRKAPR